MVAPEELESGGSISTNGVEGPHLWPDARRLDRISFEEMLEMAGQGSRVLHLRSVEFAARHGVRLRVLSSFRPGPGTLICEEDTQVEAPVVAGIAFKGAVIGLTAAWVHRSGALRARR